MVSQIYHPGELEVQRRAGVRETARRVGRSIHSTIPEVAGEFLRCRQVVFLGAAAADGRPWASILTGPPGFIEIPDEHTLHLGAALPEGDPLAEALSAESDVGLLAIDLATRRRMRANGRGVPDASGLTVRLDQVYSNCTRYIQPRDDEDSLTSRLGLGKTLRTDRLTPTQRRRVAAADTFIVASLSPGHGADVSHRGGPPGFVEVQSPTRLAWPDFAGNTMFNTLGNLAAYPRAGLLFLDFETGRTLQITGRAEIDWTPESERQVVFDVEEVIERVDAGDRSDPVVF